MSTAGLASHEQAIERAVARVAMAPVQCLAALFDDGLPSPDWGEELPPLWHLAALPTWPDQSSLGADGHPMRGVVVPPDPLARRMFAGTRLGIDRPLTVGAAVTVEREVTNVETKAGRTGELVIVTLAQRIHTSGATAPAILEHQQLIYRGSTRSDDIVPAAIETAADRASLRQVAPWHWHLATDPVLLFRFSAATANSHRIHYDLTYAREVEGHPGLVVHGPLIALALAELVRLELPGRTVRTFSFRARQPMYCGETVCLRGHALPVGPARRVDLVAGRCDAALPCASAEAVCE